MLAFGPGIYITIFPTPWELSTIYSVPRFILLTSFAVLGMVTWIIFAHNLWEKPTKKGDVRLRKLYNYTTITTLLVIILINYTVLFRSEERRVGKECGFRCSTYRYSTQ